MVKETKEFTIKKPNQIITISNGNITLMQRKAYNVLLHKALLDLKIDNSKQYFTISIAEIEEKAGIQDTNNKRVKQDLEVLMNMTVKCIDEKSKNWASFVLLSQIIKDGKLLRFEFPNIIRTALINNDYYTTLDLIIIKTIQSKYALILYEVAIRYCKVEIPKFSIDDFKILTGTENYKNFKDLRIKVIEPAISEINEKSDINISYKTFVEGRKVTGIKFYIKRKLTELKTDQKTVVNPKPIDKIDQQVDNLIALVRKDHRHRATIKSLLTQFYNSHGFDYVKYNIEYANNNSKSDYLSYLSLSLESNWGLRMMEEPNSEQSVGQSVEIRRKEYDEYELSIRLKFWKKINFVICSIL